MKVNHIMEYRILGKSGLKVSALSIGAMRLPADTEKAVRLLRRAVDLGCTYIDTSRGYPESEIKVGKALKNGYRERVVLSTKCSPWVWKKRGYTTSADHTRSKIEESMKRLDVGYLDFYQVWSVYNEENFKQATAAGGMVAGIRQAIKEGLVGHVGVTVHTPVGLTKIILETGIFEAITVSFNVMNLTYEPAMATAAKLHIGVVVMNPFCGGLLARQSNTLAAPIPGSSSPMKTAALRFVLDHPHVTTAISGFSRISDIEEDVAIAQTAPLTAKERLLLGHRFSQLRKKSDELCTQCGYCMVCPRNIEIKTIMHLKAQAEIFGFTAWARKEYAAIPSEKNAGRCNRCGKCEKKCTNHVAIRKQLAKAHAFLGKEE